MPKAALRQKPGHALWLAGLVILGSAAPAVADDRAGPYAASSFLTNFKLDWSSLQRRAAGSDNWPTSWAADGFAYSAWGDGGGFTTGDSREGFVSLGVAKLSGKDAGSLEGENLIGGYRPKIAPCLPSLGSVADTSSGGKAGGCGGKGLHGKSRSILALDDDLYMFITPGRGDAGYSEARLYKARIGTNGWQRADWAFTRNSPERLLEPAFVQAGRNNRDAGEYVYAYAARYAPQNHDGLAIQKGPDGGEIALLRAPRGANLMNRDSWDFYAGADDSGDAKWSRSASDIKPTIADPKGVGWTTSAAYVKGLKRYLVITQHSEHAAGKFTLLEAKNPWGPWKTVAQTTLEDPKKRIDTRGFYYNFLANSFSDDGKDFTLVYTGRGNGDALLAVDGSFDKGVDAPDEDRIAATKDALERRAKRGGSIAAAMDLGRRARSRREEDTSAGLAAGLAALPEDGRLGLSAFPVGEASLPEDGERGDPTRAGFTQAFAPEARDGGAGFDYGLTEATRIGLVISDYSGQDGRNASDSGASLASRTVDFYAQQRLGGFDLETRLAYSSDRYQLSELDRGAGRHDRASFDGSTTTVSQRVGYPVRRNSLLVTPWAELGYDSQKIEGFTVGSAYLADESYGASEVGDTLASFGLDAALDPFPLGDRASLTLQGGLFYTHGLAQDDYELRVKDAGSGSRTETIERPATRLAGFSLGANLAYNGLLKLESTLALEQDLAGGDTEIAPRIALTLNF